MRTCRWVQDKELHSAHAGVSKSFEDATVQEIAIKRHRAAVRFSNGKVIELYGDGGTWSISKLEGERGREFFE